VHGGCTSDSDCPGSMKCLNPDEEPTSTRFCVITCEDDVGCNFIYNALKCTGVAQDAQANPYNYCRQHPPPV
jgi:hypothetical protein